MLKTIGVNLSITNKINIDKNNTVNKIDDNGIVETKLGSKMAKSKSNKTTKSKGKNLVKSCLAKFQSSAQSSRLCFLTPEAKLAFIKLRQAFIETLILHYFNLIY